MGSQKRDFSTLSSLWKTPYYPYFVSNLIRLLFFARQLFCILNGKMMIFWKSCFKAAQTSCTWNRSCGQGKGWSNIPYGFLNILEIPIPWILMLTIAQPDHQITFSGITYHMWWRSRLYWLKFMEFSLVSAAYADYSKITSLSRL